MDVGLVLLASFVYWRSRWNLRSDDISVCFRQFSFRHSVYFSDNLLFNYMSDMVYAFYLSFDSSSFHQSRQMKERKKRTCQKCNEYCIDYVECVDRKCNRFELTLESIPK